MTIYFPINFDPPRKVIPQLPLVLGLSWPLTSHLQTPQGHKNSHHHSVAFDRWIGHEARPAEGQRCWHEGQIPSIRQEKNTSWLLVFRMDFLGVGFWGSKIQGPGPFLHVGICDFRGENVSNKSSEFTASRSLCLLNPSEFEETEFGSQKAITVAETNIAPETPGVGR